LKAHELNPRLEKRKKKPGTALDPKGRGGKGGKGKKHVQSRLLPVANTIGKKKKRT